MTRRKSSDPVIAAALTKQGRIKVEKGYEIAYRVYGHGSRNIIACHGGPGVSSRYLTRLAEAIGDDHKLVLYDMLGGGDSDWPDDPSLWQLQRFVDELETVRLALDLGQVTIFGQSFGGMLALQYALDHPQNVKGLILSNTTASAPDYLLDISEHRVALGKELHATLLRHEHMNTEDSPAYKAAVLELECRHLRRSTPFDPEISKREFREIVESVVGKIGPAYALWGPHEFKGTGPEAEFDVSARLGEIRVPALILCGWFDELTPKRCSRPLADGIADNEFVVFGNSSHMTILEKEAEAYLAVIRDFLVRRGL